MQGRPTSSHVTTSRLARTISSATDGSFNATWYHRRARSTTKNSSYHGTAFRSMVISPLTKMGKEIESGPKASDQSTSPPLREFEKTPFLGEHEDTTVRKCSEPK